MISTFRYLLFSFLFIFCFKLDAFERHIALVVREDFKGERSFALRIEKACSNINWKADVIYLQENLQIEDGKYDFVINMTPGFYKFPKCNNYITIYAPYHHFFNYEGYLFKGYRKYDGYLLTYSPKDYGDKKDFKDSKKFPYMRWYPTVHKQSYKQVDPSHLFFLCCPWGNRYEDPKFCELFNLLDKEPFARMYGDSRFQDIYPNSYQSEIPYDSETLYKLYSDAGVSLVIHSSDHNKFGIPSGRIFEAAATSTVIICDQNSFVKKHFGDSVLYIDTTQDALSIFNQIQSHMNWIKDNKTEALKLARQSYQIYRKNFLLEDQLKRLSDFHDKLTD